MSGFAAGSLGHSTAMWSGECGMRSGNASSRHTTLTRTLRTPHSALPTLVRLTRMIALARKYRPKQFSDLIAQEHVAAALRGAVAGGRGAPGYLFAGPRGGGETTAARVLAMALNCERRGAGAGGGGPGEGGGAGARSRC